MKGLLLGILISIQIVILIWGGWLLGKENPFIILPIFSILILIGITIHDYIEGDL